MTDQELIHKLKVGGIVSIRDYLLEQQVQGQKIARTESGDPSFDIPPNVKESITTALTNNKTHYTAGAGITELRQAIYNKCLTTNKLSLTSAQQVIVTNGAMNALFAVFHALNDNKGWSVFVPTPTWTETVQNVVEVGGNPIYYTFDPFSNTPLDFEELDDLLTADVKAIVINSPHNPTGKVLEQSELEQLIAFCKLHDLYLVSDEAYEHCIFDGIQHISPASLSDYEKIITIFSFSKSYAMSGLRLGCVVTQDKEILQRLAKIIRCTINGVNSITQWGGVSALQATPDWYMKLNLEEYTVRRNLIYEGAVQAKYLEPVQPEGTFYLWCKISDAWCPEIKEDRGWWMTLAYLKLGVGSAPGEVFGPGGKNHIRFSFSCSTEDVKLAAELLQQL